MDEREAIISHYRRQIAHYTKQLDAVQDLVRISAKKWVEFYTGMIAKYEEPQG